MASESAPGELNTHIDFSQAVERLGQKHAGELAIDRQSKESLKKVKPLKSTTSKAGGSSRLKKESSSKGNKESLLKKH